MKINFQIMSEEQKLENGKYIPDWKKLIENATCEEEADYIRSLHCQEISFPFNMVYVTKQNCGHYEIFQSPQNQYYTVEEVLRLAEDLTKDKCTSCICNI